MSQKTLAIRLDADLHARLTILARLTEVSTTEVIRRAIETEVARLASSQEIADRASDLQTAIAREADEQRAAIQALFGDQPAAPAPTKGRSSSKAGSSSAS